MPERALEEVRRRHVVGVEQQQELGVGLREAVVEVAGLRMGVRRAGEVARAEGGGHPPHLVAGAIVEHEHVADPTHRDGASHGRLEHGQRLVAGADERIDAAFSSGGTMARHLMTRVIQRNSAVDSTP